MKRTFGILTDAVRPVLLTSLVAMVASPAQAAYVVDVRQVGSDVVATGSGSINLSGLTLKSSPRPPFISVIDPSTGVIRIGNYLTPYIDIYSSAIFGPATFGSGIYTNTLLTSGPRVGIDFGRCIVDPIVNPIPGPTCGEVYVPTGYQSGADLAANSSTWENSTLATLGLEPGTYVWQLGAGPDADSFTLRIGAAVPEPATWGMMIVGLGAIGAAFRRREVRRQAFVV